MQFHEIGDDDWRAMCDAGVTWRDIADCFQRPSWCRLHEALDPMGCWSLTGRHVHSEADCKPCEDCTSYEAPTDKELAPA